MVNKQQGEEIWMPCMWNGIKRPCYLFGRKFHPDTLDKLLDLFSNYTKSVSWQLWFKRVYLLLYTQILWPTFGSSSAWPLKSILRKIHRSCNTRCLEALGGIENFFQLLLHLGGGRRWFNFSFSTLLFGISHIVYFNCCEKKRIFVFVFVDRFIFFVQNVEETNLYSFIEFLFIYICSLVLSLDRLTLCLPSDVTKYKTNQLQDLITWTWQSNLLLQHDGLW